MTGRGYSDPASPKGAQRDEVERSLLSWMAEPLWGEDEERFAGIALALFAHQFEHCAPYRAFCCGRGRTPDALRDWRDIPAVPTGAFKELALRSFPEELETKRFDFGAPSRLRKSSIKMELLARI